MDMVIEPTRLSGLVKAPPSKSQAHRLLIAAALADRPSLIECPATNDDIEATACCLRALGAEVRPEPGQGFRVAPLDPALSPASPVLDCGESGSTLRFLLPVACALGTGAVFRGSGRLLERPVRALQDALEAHGARIGRSAQGLQVSGRLHAGRFLVRGDVSSQFVTGLLFASRLLDGPSQVAVTEPVSSRPYIDMTVAALRTFGAQVPCARAEAEGTVAQVFSTEPGPLAAPAGPVPVEGDWSAAAFWLCAGALGSPVTVDGLCLFSAQGDRSVLGALAGLGNRVSRGQGRASVGPDDPRGRTLDVDLCPDLVPPLAAVCALTPGASALTGAARLRHKESDRLATVGAGLRALGAEVTEKDDGLAFTGVPGLTGGCVDACGDHRIAMMAAIAATRATGPVTVLGAQCVAKSYPGFWEDYRSLGGRARPLGSEEAL